MGRLKRRLIRWLRRCLQRVLDWLPTDYEPVWTPLSPELEKALKQIIDHDPSRRPTRPPLAAKGGRRIFEHAIPALKPYKVASHHLRGTYEGS